MTRQAHAGQYVDFVEIQPLLVAGLEEVDIVIDAQVVHQDVDVRLGGEQRLRPGGGAQVGDHATGLAVGGTDAGHGFVNGSGVASDYDHVGAGSGQLAGDAQADTAGGATDDGGLAAEIDLHVSNPHPGGARDVPVIVWIWCHATRGLYDRT
ncbi:hypothetical protein D3C84_827810 [compost metagenome]